MEPIPSPTEFVSEAVFRSATPSLGNTTTWAGHEGERSLQQEKAVHFMDEQETKMRMLELTGFLLSSPLILSTPAAQEEGASYSAGSPSAVSP